MMKKFATIIISTVLFILTLSVILNGQVNNSNYITFIQGDSIFRIDSSIDSLVLEKKPFAIRYFCKQYDDEGGQYYAAQIAVLKNPGNMICLAVGKKTKSIPYFASGTGLASDANG
ncbi:MAG TPA: hypothetical protein VI731_12040, partial [Bacteroidia bacterium]|nr:hypothetical protein [Bacteroidia bacterium]